MAASSMVSLNMSRCSAAFAKTFSIISYWETFAAFKLAASARAAVTSRSRIVEGDINSCAAAADLPILVGEAVMALDVLEVGLARYLDPVGFSSGAKRGETDLCDLVFGTGIVDSGDWS